MPCGIAIVRWGECKHSMLLKVGCTAGCGDEDICASEEQQTMVRTLFRWLCEECHSHRALVAEGARDKYWQARVAAVEADAQLSTEERTQHVWIKHVCESWEQERQEQRRVAQVQEIEFAADWTYEYGLAAFEVLHPPAKDEAVAEAEKQQPHVGEQPDEGPAPGIPLHADDRQRQPQRGDDDQRESKGKQAEQQQQPEEPQQSNGDQYKVPPKTNGKDKLKMPVRLKKHLEQTAEEQLPQSKQQEEQPPLQSKQQKEQPRRKGEKQPKDEDEVEVQEVEDVEEKSEESEGHQRRRPDSHRTIAPESRIVKLRNMLPADLHVMLDVLRTKEELREALEDQLAGRYDEDHEEDNAGGSTGIGRGAASSKSSGNWWANEPRPGGSGSFDAW